MSGKAARIVLTEKTREHSAANSPFDNGIAAAHSTGWHHLTGFRRLAQRRHHEDGRLGAKASGPLAATLAAVIRRVGGYRMSRNAG